MIGTSTGLRPIETIRPGDQVWAYDIVRSNWRLCTVLDNFIRELAGDLVSVTISGDTIESTFRHPYWVISGEDLENRPTFPHIEKVPSTATTPGRWVDAGDLQIGDILLLRDGRQVPVENIRVAFIEQKVYNFSVAELKCYTVGSNQILVHNSDCDDIVNATKRTTWPSTADEMDEFLGIPGQKIPDTPTTLGRDKTVWRPNADTKITLERHPYHPDAPNWHQDYHWHLDIPSNLHQRYLPGDAIPGLGVRN